MHIRNTLLLLCLAGFAPALTSASADAAIRDGDAGAYCAACNGGWHSAPLRGAPAAGLLDISADEGRSIPVVPPARGQVYPRSGPVIQRASAASTDEQGAEESVSATLVVTAAYPDYFYGQSQDGFWGVRVNYPGHGFVADEKVSIRGTVVFSEEGELTIEATAGSAQGMQPLEPVFLSNRAVAGSASPVLPFGRYSHPPVEGGAGLGTPGVLLRTGGVVTAVSPDGTAMTISDGSAWGGLGMHDAEGNEGIRVFVPDGPPPPAGTYVQVKGVGSYYQAGGSNYASVKVPAGALVDWLKLRSIRVQFIRVSDDDGSRTADITPLQAAEWVARANAVLGQAGIAFLYDPDNDFTDFNSTLLNNMSGNGDADWQQASGLANFLASYFYKGKMVVFVRQATGGFSWWDLNFVAMPAYHTYHCGSLNTSLFSHEIGHYLGLWHTFPTDPFPSVYAAEQYFINNGKDPAIFDGDGLPDTLPDPGIFTLECGSTSSVTLAGVTFQLPRDNLMSYYKDADTLSPLQKDRLLWTVDWRAANKMPSPANAPTGGGIMEAEDMPFTTHVDCPFGVQWMTPWGSEHWSNGRQVFGGCTKGGEISFPFQVAQSGYYTLAAYMTHAPDYGRVGFWVDGTYKAYFDGYGPYVAPSGRIGLGSSKMYLAAGDHTIKAKVIGKSPKSWNYFMGIDCFQIN